MNTTVAGSVSRLEYLESVKLIMDCDICGNEYAHAMSGIGLINCNETLAVCPDCIQRTLKDACGEN
jgi:hypothetical protein